MPEESRGQWQSGLRLASVRFLRLKNVGRAQCERRAEAPRVARGWCLCEEGGGSLCARVEAQRVSRLRAQGA